MNDNNHSADASTEASGFTAIRVAGDERLTFLQGQLTNDLSLLRPDQPLLAGWNSPKGRLFFVSWLVDWQDAIWFVVPDELAPAISKRLSLFVLRAAVSVEISALPVYLLADKQPEERAAGHCICDDNCAQLFAPGGNWQIGGTAPGPEAAATRAAWQLAAVRAGRAVIWPATSEDFVPQMVNLDLVEGISFSKGCYVGQEIVARTQNLGRIKRRMYRFKASEGPVAQPGDIVKCGDHGAGKVVSAALAETGATVELLAVIRIESRADQLALEDGRTLEPLTLPYAVPD